MRDSSTVTALAIRFSNRLMEGRGVIENATSHGGSMHDARSGGAACYQKDYWTASAESTGLPILTPDPRIGRASYPRNDEFPTFR
jgi:hypothetical protein